MQAQASPATSPASHDSEAGRLYDQLTGLASLMAFPVAKLPPDLASVVGAATEAAEQRIRELLPQYCGFGLGEVVDVAEIQPGIGAGLVESVFINEGGSPSILLRAVSGDGTVLAQHMQFPLFYARTALTPVEAAPADPEDEPAAPAP